MNKHNTIPRRSVIALLGKLGINSYKLDYYCGIKPHYSQELVIDFVRAFKHG